VPKYKSSQIFLYWDDELTNKTNDMNDDFVMDDSFADFVNDLTTNKANENACSIDNPDCEGCGS
jgi:hypothetical protein|tara:strand:- start:1211 stop:1402 length:192 start_codon:yes stop_codon:yes gene_type:complete